MRNLGPVSCLKFLNFIKLKGQICKNKHISKISIKIRVFTFKFPNLPKFLRFRYTLRENHCFGPTLSRNLCVQGAKVLNYPVLRCFTTIERLKLQTHPFSINTAGVWCPMFLYVFHNRPYFPVEPESF